MRTFFAYVVLISCLSIYMVSSHRGVMRKLNIYKTSNDGWFRSDRRYGDLYGRAFLPYFRKHYHQTGSVRADSCGVAKRMNLYAIGDSYLWMFADSAKFYCGVDRFTSAKTNKREKLSVVLDSSKINVLLFEISERNIRSIFSDSLYIGDMVRPQHQGSQTTIDNMDMTDQAGHDKPGSPHSRQVPHSMIGSSKVMDLVFNKDINTNLESNLWDVSWFTPVKEFKAAVNYNLFGVVDKGVYVSTDRHRLYFNETIDTAYLSSSFKPVPENTVDSIVDKLNDLYLKARSTGFRKVYLSIIPNPVSLLEPRFQGLVYNRLVDRIQQSPRLKISYIDLLPVFSKWKEDVYYRADTHWTPFGAQVWLDEFNKELYKTVEER